MRETQRVLVHRSPAQRSALAVGAFRWERNLSECWNSVPADVSVGTPLQQGFGVQRVQRFEPTCCLGFTWEWCCIQNHHDFRCGPSAAAQQCPNAGPPSMRSLQRARAAPVPPSKGMKDCSLLAADPLMGMKVFSCWFCIQNGTMFSVGCARFLPWLPLPRGAVWVLCTSPGDRGISQQRVWLTPTSGLGPSASLAGLHLQASFFLLASKIANSPCLLEVSHYAQAQGASCGAECSHVSLGNLTTGLENVMEMQKSII